MLSINIKTLRREQFIQLREARKLIKEEFSETISLTDDGVLDEIYKYALESENEALFDIFESFKNAGGSQIINANDTNKTETAKPTNGLFTRKTKVQVGDVIDGKKVVRMYRGAPVFEDT